MSDLTDPPLTSIEQHGSTVGYEATRLLIDRLENRRDNQYQTKIIKTELVIKGSTRHKDN
jgi:LacI family transcriptional regulator